MAAYYNEFDPQAAAWLRELIKQGHIAAGDVDDRDMREVSPDDLKGYTQHHFFAGIGGWSYALRLAGWDDTRPVLTGSPPCQPFSTAGKGLGVADERHLAPVWLELVKSIRPACIIGEQVAAAVNKDNWLDDLLNALEAEGYSTGAVVLPACSVGSPHIRQRLWFTARLADTERRGLQGRAKQCLEESVLPAESSKDIDWNKSEWLLCGDGKQRPVEPSTFPLADGIPARVGRLRGYGNAIVPQVAAEIVKTIMEGAI